MANRLAVFIIVPLLLLTPLVVAADGPRTQDGNQSSLIELKPLSRECLTKFDGEFLYKELCVVCHGVSGSGNGFAKRLLDSVLPDLTHLSAENGGRFPSLRVMHAISGMYHENLPGSAMPGWESILGGENGREMHARLRIHNLTRYVKSLQEREVSER